FMQAWAQGHRAHDRCPSDHLLAPQGGGGRGHAYSSCESLATGARLLLCSSDLTRGPLWIMGSRPLSGMSHPRPTTSNAGGPGCGTSLCVDLSYGRTLDGLAPCHPSRAVAGLAPMAQRCQKVNRCVTV